MPSKPRFKPVFLASKLLKIREDLGLSQNEMVRRLNAEDQIDRAKISEFESGRRIPTLNLLLAYARAGSVSVEYLIDDELKLSNFYENTYSKKK